MRVQGEGSNLVEGEVVLHRDVQVEARRQVLDLRVRDPNSFKKKYTAMDILKSIEIDILQSITISTTLDILMSIAIDILKSTLTDILKSLVSVGFCSPSRCPG